VHIRIAAAGNRDRLAGDADGERRAEKCDYVGNVLGRDQMTDFA